MKILFIALLSTIPYIIAYRNISPYKLTFKEYVIMEISIVITYFLLSLINPNLSSLALYFLPIFFIYKKSCKFVISVFLDIFICIVIVLTDSFIGAIGINLLNIEANIGSINYIILLFIILIAIHFVSKLVGYCLNKYKNNILENYKSKYAILIYLSLIITFSIFYMNINWKNSNDPIYLSKINSIFFVFYSFILLFICLILVFVIKKEENYKINEMQLENLKEYTNNLEELYMDMRKFRHDYINILSSINGFIDDGNLNDLKAYFNDTIYPLNKKISRNNHKLGLLQNIKITEVKGLVSSKLIRAQELGLDVDIDVMEAISEINMNRIDLIRAVGIILDNAIEAAITSKDKSITMGIIKRSKSVTIIVVNSFSSNIPSISMLFKEGYSSKGENRGLGLSNLKELVNSNKNVLLDTSINNEKFIQVLTVKNH